MKYQDIPTFNQRCNIGADDHADIQRKPLSDEMQKQMKEQRCDSMEMRSAFIDGWLSAEAAHGIGGEHG